MLWKTRLSVSLRSSPVFRFSDAQLHEKIREFATHIAYHEYIFMKLHPLLNNSGNAFQVHFSIDSFCHADQIIASSIVFTDVEHGATTRDCGKQAEIHLGNSYCRKGKILPLSSMISNMN